MKMRKRWLTVLLAICVLVVSVTPRATLAAVETEAESTAADTAGSAAVADAQSAEEESIAEDVSDTDTGETDALSGTDAEESQALTSSVADSANESVSEDEADDQSENSVTAYETEDKDTATYKYTLGSAAEISALTGLSVSYSDDGLEVSWSAVEDESVDILCDFPFGKRARDVDD